MPELPEVETTVRAISKFKNKTLKEIIVHNKNLRWKVADKVELANKNKKIIVLYSFLAVYFTFQG